MTEGPKIPQRHSWSPGASPLTAGTYTGGGLLQHQGGGALGGIHTSLSSAMPTSGATGDRVGSSPLRTGGRLALPPNPFSPPPDGRQRHRALVIKTLRSAPVSTSLPYSYFNLKLSYIYYIQAKSCRPESSILYQPYECIYSLEPQDLPTNVHITHKQNYNQHTHTHIAIMPGQTDSYTISIPVSPPPPQSISTYSRFMHDHTKRQMESFGAIAPAGGSRGSTSSSSVSSSLTNGVGHSEYH